jgi:hypothetical protein
VCIAGAGPAGIVLALALERAGLSTVLLEAGLLDEPGPNGRDAYSGEVTGLAYPLRASRLRWFGGTTNHWGGWCMPLNEIDYSRRPGSPLPSWPIGPADVAPFVEAASTWCELSSSQFDAYQGITNPAEQLLFAGDEMFTDQLFRFSPPTNFGKSYRQEVADSTTIRCVYNATLVSMEHEVGIVRDALAASPEGDTVKIIAQRFVLAMGGIENPRFLLHLADTTGANFGQASGLVGACFMDHFGFAPGYLEASSGLRYDRHQVRGAPVMPVITVRPEVQQNLNLPSIRIEATPVGFSPELPHAFFHNPGILGALRNNAARYSLIMNVEPTAHADSRITLGNERDAFGIRRIRLCWQVLSRIIWTRSDSWRCSSRHSAGKAWGVCSVHGDSKANTANG